MPIIHVEMLAGRPAELKQALAEQLTQTVVETLGVSPQAVRVILHEVEPGDWYTAGKPIGLPPDSGAGSAADQQ